MLSWLAKKMTARNTAKASAGDLGPTLRLDAEDGSWNQTICIRGRDHLEDRYLAYAGDALSRQAIGGSS